MTLYICHKCGASFSSDAAKYKDYKCKFCGNILVAEEVSFEIYSDADKYVFDKYIKGDPIKESKFEKMLVQADQDFVEFTKQTEERLAPKCPRCGSKFITTGQRGFSIWTGFIGSNRTMNRCGNCGHKWYP